MSGVTAAERSLMRVAVDAATEARRRVAPWPHVGAAVLTDDGTVVAGATGSFPTGPHAEVDAIANAGAARLAALATTLEPCDHHGNTPPCTDAIIAAGIPRVLVGIEDPDPKVAGRGIARLRAAGIQVDIGAEAAAVERQLAAYLHQRRTGRAYCVVKVATSLDGRIAAADGTSRWISGAEARRDAHELRADSQAIIVGAGTARADDPALTVRDAGGPPIGAQPLRVLLDGRGRVPATGALADTSLAPTLVVTTDRAPRDYRAAWQASGAEVVEVGFVVDAAGSGVDLAATLELLGARGVLQAMVEGGAYLHGALLRAGLADRIVAYVANTLLGSDGLAGYGLGGVATIADAPRWRLVDVARCGDDVRLDYVAPPKER